jgi:hypothetical protein
VGCKARGGSSPLGRIVRRRRSSQKLHRAGLPREVWLRRSGRAREDRGRFDHESAKMRSMGESANGYLLILADREALAWVLREERMAFPAKWSWSAGRLQVGDRLLLYTTRTAFHNPKRDRGRVIGIAAVGSRIEHLREPLTIAGRSFTSACRLKLEGVAALREGVELAPLVPQLSVFPDPATWSAHMRRPFLSLPPSDFRLLERMVRPLLQNPRDVLDDYVAASRAA